MKDYPSPFKKAPFWVALSLLAGTLLSIRFFLQADLIPLKEPFEQFPEKVGKWKAVGDHTFDEEIMSVLRVDDFLFRSYSDGRYNPTLYIGYYRSQRQGAQIHSPKHCLPGSGWFQLSEKVDTLSLKDGGELHFVEAVYQKGTSKEIFLYWYDMQGETLTSDYLLKAGMVWNALRYNRSDASFVRLSLPIRGDNLEEGKKVIRKFLLTLLPQIRLFLPLPPERGS